MKMKFLCIFLLMLLGVFAFISNSSAFPVTIQDEYIGGEDHGKGDVIGDIGLFEIHYADIDLSGSVLTVDIYTEFAGEGHKGLFSDYTYGETGIGYGDLFLSNKWDPYGSPDYPDDKNSNGTIWQYGFALDNRYWDGIDGSGGNGTLYSLPVINDVPGGRTDALLAEDFITGATYRNGQEIAVGNTISDVTSGSPSWSIGDDYIRFQMDISNTNLLYGPEIAIHWGETCGNDVIEGSANVPEPANMLLVGSGLIGLAGLGRRKFLR